jgi:hypothetical protein
MSNFNILELQKKWAHLLGGPKRSIEPEKSETKVTASKLQDQLLKDSEYQNWLREMEEVREMLENAYAEDAKPLVDDLRKLGFNFSSPWDLVNIKSKYKTAIPILIEHLAKPYLIKNKEGIARALAVKEAKGIACNAVLHEYNNTPKYESNFRWVLGNTMAVIITPEYVDDVIEIVQDEKNNESRQMFVAALGNIKTSRVRDVLQKLMNDNSNIIKKEALKALNKL